MYNSVAFEKIFPIHVSKGIQKLGVVFYEKLIYHLNESGYRVQEYSDSFLEDSNNHIPQIFIDLYDDFSTTLTNKDLAILIDHETDRLFDTLDINTVVVDVDTPLDTYRNLIHLYFDQIIYSDILPVIDRSAKNYRALIQRVKNYTGLIKNLEEDWAFDIKELTSELYEFQERLFKVQDSSEINDIINDFRKKEILPDMSVDSIPNINDKNVYSIPIAFLRNENIFLIIDQDSINSESMKQSYSLTFVINALVSFYQNLYPYLSSNKDQIIWQKCFQLIEVPMAVLSEDGELIHHNKHFINMGISAKECMKFTHDDQVNVRDKIYKIYKNDFNYNSQKFFFLTFQGDHHRQEGLDSQELGIITSSIAHELNNPLGGILASMQLLSLYDEIDDETKKEMSGIEEGVRRCVDLVDVFLGFSKSKSRVNDEVTLNEIYDKAMQLLRFRIVETNIKLKFDWNVRNFFGRKINNSIFTMVFYLIFSELLTTYSHNSLITSNDEEANVLSGEILEDKKELHIHIKQKFPFFEKLTRLPLVDYLLEIHRFSMIVEKDRIILRTKV